MVESDRSFKLSLGIQIPRFIHCILLVLQVSLPREPGALRVQRHKAPCLFSFPSHGHFGQMSLTGCSRLFREGALFSLLTHPHLEVTSFWHFRFFLFFFTEGKQFLPFVTLSLPSFGWIFIAGGERGDPFPNNRLLWTLIPTRQVKKWSSERLGYQVMVTEAVRACQRQRPGSKPETHTWLCVYVGLPTVAFFS